MSMTRDGTWKAGVWAPTVWASGVWYETPAPPTPPAPSSIAAGGGGSLGYFKTKRGKRLYSQFFDDIVDEMRREKEMQRVHADIAERFGHKAKLAERELEQAYEYAREQQRKRRMRKAAVLLLLVH